MTTFTFLDAYTFVFDENGTMTRKGALMSPQEWFELANKMVGVMNASDKHIQALQQVVEWVDWSQVSFHDAGNFFFQLADIDVIGSFSRYVECYPELLDKVMDCALHRSSSQELEVVLNNHSQWQPPIGLIRDFLAHLVYNTIPAGHDYQKSLALFLQRCEPQRVVDMFEHNAHDFFDVDDHNWESTFVADDIDQYSEAWNIDQQQHLCALAAPRIIFPLTRARVQKYVLEQEIANNLAAPSTVENVKRRI